MPPMGPVAFPSGVPPTVGFIGAPCEVGACFKGAALAPQAFRRSRLLEALQQRGRAVHDWGDLDGPVFDKKHPGLDVYFLAEIQEWTEIIYGALSSIFGEGQVPLMVGGDHACAIGSIMAASSFASLYMRPVHVVWFDAHADFNTPETTVSGHIHGMPLSTVCGYGLAQNFGLLRPVIQEEDVTLIGIRDVDADEQTLLNTTRIHQAPMRVVKAEGIDTIINRAIEAAHHAGAHLHVSFDVDGIDSALAPATGTPSPKGLTADHMHRAFELLNSSGLVRSVDVVELNPPLDTDGRTTKLTQELLLSLLG